MKTTLRLLARATASRLHHLQERGVGPEQLLFIEGLVRSTGQAFNIDPAALLSRGRSGPVSQARHAFVYVLRERMGLGLETIGLLLGGRDHTTIMSSARRAEQLALLDPVYAGRLHAILESTTPAGDQSAGVVSGSHVTG